MARHSAFNRKLRMGMVGGGPGSFIGAVHLKAARMDGQIELVAGAFSSVPEKSRVTGSEQFLDPARVYGCWQEMIEKESQRPDRIDFVSIVTPNHLHFPIARGFLRGGFHVVCDKPMTLNLKEALALRDVVKRSGRVFALTHNYTGYPMVKLARDMVKAGDLGKLRKIKVQYPQGWLHSALEMQDVKQAVWRTDSRTSGAAGCMGDIGTHAENLAEYITGLIHWEKGVKGLLFASQISIGEENGLAIWIYGDKAGLEWHQEHPNYLYVKKPDAPVEVWRRGNGYVAAKSPAAGRATRLPSGHPEGFIEAFANIYINVAETIRASIAHVRPEPLALDFPTVEDGVRGLQFIETVVKSARTEGKWVKFPEG
jgi:predicted dehydrogenase